MVFDFPRCGGIYLFPWVFFAQQETAGSPEGPSLLGLLWPILAIVILFWLFLIRPQQKEREKIARMLANPEKNDRVITIGGIYGVVTNIRREADEVTLKVDRQQQRADQGQFGGYCTGTGRGARGAQTPGRKSPAVVRCLLWCLCSAVLNRTRRGDRYLKRLPAY